MTKDAGHKFEYANTLASTWDGADSIMNNIWLALCGSASVGHSTLDQPLLHKIEILEFGLLRCVVGTRNQQGLDPALIVVGLQAARWRGNNFKGGLGTWLAPSRKQAHTASTTQRSDSLPIVVGFYTAWRSAAFVQRGSVDLLRSHRYAPAVSGMSKGNMKSRRTRKNKLQIVAKIAQNTTHTVCFYADMLHKCCTNVAHVS